MPTYNVDLSGTDPANLITPALGVEEKTLINNDTLSNRVFQPVAAPFFEDSLIVEWQNNSSGAWVELTPNADYKLAYRFTGASLSAGKSVYAGIIINSGNSPGKVRFKQYRTIGGPWSGDKTAAVNAIINGNYDVRVVHWDEVHSVPESLPLTPHLLAATDLTPHNDLIAAINALTQEIGDDNHDTVLQYLLNANKCGEICDPVDRAYINGILERIRAISLATQEAIDAVVLPEDIDLTNNGVATTVGLEIGPSNNAKTKSVSIGLGSGVVNCPESTVNIGSDAGKSNNDTLTYGYVVYNLLANDYFSTPPSPTNEKSNTINIGVKAGLNNAEGSGVNIGLYAGEEDSTYGSVNIGRGAGREDSGGVGVNVGLRAGRIKAGTLSVNIGALAGDIGQSGAAYHDYLDGTTESTSGIAANPLASNNNSRVVNIGNEAGVRGSKQGTINIGHKAGSFTSSDATSGKGLNAINIGVEAGLNAGSSAVNIGYSAGKLTEMGTFRVRYPISPTVSRYITLFKGDRAVSIGHAAGADKPGVRSVNIGEFTGRISEDSAVSIGTYSGSIYAKYRSINMGYMAGYQYSGNSSINIGKRAGSDNVNSLTVTLQGRTYRQGYHVVNIGSLAGQFKAGECCVNIGRSAGKNTPEGDSINIGQDAGYINSKVASVNIGLKAGLAGSAPNSISIGAFSSAGEYGVSIGHSARFYRQQVHNTYIGDSAGVGVNNTSVNANRNTGVGSLSLNGVVGDNNAGMGYKSLYRTRGDYNIGLGAFAGDRNIDGNNNVFIGAHGHESLEDSPRAMFLLSLGNGGQLPPFLDDAAAVAYYTDHLSGAEKSAAEVYIRRRLIYVDMGGNLRTPL